MVESGVMDLYGARGVVHTPVSGYSTQSTLALTVARTIGDSRLNLWFATRFQALENPPTSSPLWIFSELDRADAEGVHNWKSRDLLANLLDWVHRVASAEPSLRPGCFELLDLLTQAVSRGDAGHALVLHLDGVRGALKMKQEDEYLLPDFDINDPRLTQALPRSGRQWLPAPDSAGGAGPIENASGNR